MIGRLLSHVRKLKGRSSHELYSRVSQRAYAWSERAALRFATPSTILPNVDSNSFARPFFPGISDTASTLEALRATAPRDELEVLERASAIAAGDIPLLGFGRVHIGQSPDWQRDPFNNLSAPLQHWSTIPYLDSAVVGDHKTVWEISRHQYFITLGQAWRYSRDVRWSNAFTHYLHSWLDNNPPGVGMNWASSLEVSYRAISWIWALQLMHDAPVVDNALKAKTLKSLHAHGRHLERYLSTYFSPNTHLTGEALGLFYIGTQCPELPQAERWRKLGAQILEGSLHEQVLPDGVYFEQATQYHRYTIDIYLHFLLLAQATKFAVAPNVENALHRLFDVLLHITGPDGRYPLIGDDDGGRLVQLDDRLPDDVRALLAMGAVVLKRSDLAWMGRGDDAAMCWMLGGESVKRRDALIESAPRECARAFMDGGMYVMRDGWDANAGHAVIDAGPHGALSFGHSHADALAVVLSIGGRPLFVDAGTYTYVGAERNAFRSTSAHNTVEIDGRSTSVPSTAFRWQSVAHPLALSWTSEPEFTCFAGRNAGYASLDSPLEHVRTVLQLAPGLWALKDQLLSGDAHDAVLRWHCAIGIDAIAVASEPGFSCLTLTEGATRRALLVTMGGLGGGMHVEGAWVSEQFGHKSPSPVCAWRERTNGNAVLASIVIDPEHHQIDWEVTARLRKEVGGAVGVLALTSKRSGVAGHRAVVIGGDAPVTYRNLRFAADIACITLDASDGNLIGITSVGVTNAVENDVTFVRPGTEKHWVTATNTSAGSWQVRSGMMVAPVAQSSGNRRFQASIPSTV